MVLSCVCMYRRVQLSPMFSYDPTTAFYDRRLGDRTLFWGDLFTRFLMVLTGVLSLSLPAEVCARFMFANNFVAIWISSLKCSRNQVHWRYLSVEVTHFVYGVRFVTLVGLSFGLFPHCYPLTKRVDIRVLRDGGQHWKGHLHDRNRESEVSERRGIGTSKYGLQTVGSFVNTFLLLKFK